MKRISLLLIITFIFYHLTKNGLLAIILLSYFDPIIYKLASDWQDLASLDVEFPTTYSALLPLIFFFKLG